MITKSEYKPGQGGGGGPHAASRDRPGLSLLSSLFSASRWLQVIYKKTAAAAAAADAGAVFNQIGATGISSVQHYQEQARDTSKFSAGKFIGDAGKSVI